MLIFWDVDTQVDFLHRDGRLYVPGSESILPHLARLTLFAQERQIPLISSACAHQPGDPELSLYGPHCMVGTPGQRKVKESLLPRRFTVPNHPVQLPSIEQFQQVIIEKQAFDPFTNPNAESLLRQFGGALQVLLYGVVTEICVATTASSLMERGHHVTLVQEAICALDPTKGKDAIRELQQHGADLARIDDALQG